MAYYRDGHTTEKHGTFEWIVGWQELANHLAPPAVLGLKPGAQAVDLGCGTSEVPVHLAASGYARVVAVDRDAGCIAHMHSRHGAVPGLSWRECDLVDGDLAGLLPGGSADLVLDKGTLDCALAEDTVAALLCTVHGVLAVEGVYVAISFRPAALLLPLLSCAELQMEPPDLVTISARQGGEATLCRLRRRAAAVEAPHLAPVAAATGRVLDWWYREQQPLLTDARRQKLESDWAAAAAAAMAAAAAAGLEVEEAGAPDGPAPRRSADATRSPAAPPDAEVGGPLPLHAAFGVVLSPEEQGEVGLEAFEEDVRGFLEDDLAAEISLAQALAYLAVSQ